MAGRIPSCFVFDAYGTLFDVHAAVRRHAGEIGPDASRLSEIWRAKQLEYSWVRTLAGAYRDFWALTEEALDFAFAAVPSADPALRVRLLEAYRTLDCYPEVPAVLRTLKATGARVAILSNGSPDMLDAAVRSAAIDTLVDAVFSVDAVRRFKTAPEAYELVTSAWRIYRLKCRSSPRTDGTLPAQRASGSARSGSTGPSSRTSIWTCRLR